MTAIPHARTTVTVSTTDLWKAAALLLIAVDHYGHFLDPEQDWWRVVGRAALPIWFFFIGFAQTRGVPWTWLGAGLALTALDVWFNGGVDEAYLNILINFALIRWALPWTERIVWPSAWRLTLFVVLLAAAAPLANQLLEYGTEGWLLALVGLAHRRYLEDPANPAGFWRRVALAVAAGGVFLVVEASDYAFGTNELVVLAVLIAAVSVGLGGFRREAAPGRYPFPLADILRFCGRQSLWLYVAQIVGFTLAALVAQR